MKKFKFARIKSPAPDGVHQKSRYYSIFLGPGVTRYFSSYKTARAFAADYSKEVNQSLAIFNHCLGLLYQSHRAAYFYYFGQETDAAHIAFENEISTHIRTAELWIHRAIFNTSGTYTGGQVFSHLDLISNNLQAGFNKLYSFLQDRCQYPKAAEMRIYSAQVETEFQRIRGMYFEKSSQN